MRTLLLLLLAPLPALAYVEAPMPLGAVVQQSVVVCVMTVTAVDKVANTITYKKVADLKGKHPQEVIKHSIKQELKPGEIKEIMAWAEVGKTAVFFHNGSASETFIGPTWYQAYPQGDWWGMSHGEPFLLRSFAGKPDKLIAAVTDIVAGRECLVSCMVDGDKEALHKKTAKVQRVRCSLKIQDYNPKRDFVGWGGEEIARLDGLPGFSHSAALGRVDAQGRGISTCDFDDDGKPDFCLYSTTRVALYRNTGEGFVEVVLPNLTTGARAAVWADYNGDGKPDLLLATPTGPRLYTNLGGAKFRDDSALIPQDAPYDLTGAAWLDCDGDGRPDLLLANGFHGVRLLRNEPPAGERKVSGPPQLGEWSYIGPFDNTGNKGFDAAYPPEAGVDLAKTYKGKKGADVAWKPGAFADGKSNNLALFPGENDYSVVYVTREIVCGAAAELPVSLGSDDGLAVWLNGEKLLGENVQRGCAPDQAKLTLKLKEGKNRLLLKIVQGSGAWEFYFAAAGPAAQAAPPPWFRDVSAQYGLADAGQFGGRVAGVEVGDFLGDGRACLLIAGDAPRLLAPKSGRYQALADTGLTYGLAGVPTVADFDGDGKPDIGVVEGGKVRLYQNQGGGRFRELTDALPPIAGAAGLAWGDFNNDGRLDLFVGCLRGGNRYFEAQPGGGYVEKTTALGFQSRVFNTRALAALDLNGDGKLDLVLLNEGQEAAVLFGDKGVSGGLPTLQVTLDGRPGTTLTLRGPAGVVSRQGGGQAGLARFALPAGNYAAELRGADGAVRNATVAVGAGAARLSFAGK